MEVLKASHRAVVGTSSWREEVSAAVVTMRSALKPRLDELPCSMEVLAMTEDSVRAWPWKWSLFVRRFLAVAAMFSRTHTSVATRVAAADSSSDSAHLRSRCPDWTTWKSMRALWLRQLHELQVPLTFLNFVTTTEWPICGKEFQTTGAGAAARNAADVTLEPSNRGPLAMSSRPTTGIGSCKGHLST